MPLISFRVVILIDTYIYLNLHKSTLLELKHYIAFKKFQCTCWFNCDKYILLQMFNAFIH